MVNNIKMSPKSKTFNKNDLMKLIKKTRGRDVDIKYFSGYSDLGDLCDKGYFKVQGRSEEWQRFLKSENDNKVFVSPRLSRLSWLSYRDVIAVTIC